MSQQMLQYAHDDSAVPSRFYAQILDEIDYGIILLAGSGVVIHANLAARRSLDRAHPIQIVNGHVSMPGHPCAELLREAIGAASVRGLRRLIPPEIGDLAFSIGVVPLESTPSDESGPVLLLLGKHQVCEQLSIHWYGRSHGLTTAERDVLDALVGGLEPNAIARRHQVSLATIRTHISNLRSKTGNGSISQMLRQAALLPPMVSALRLQGGSAPPTRGAEGTHAEVGSHRSYQGGIDTANSRRLAGAVTTGQAWAAG